MATTERVIELIDRAFKAEALLHRIMGNECIPLDAEEQYRALYPVDSGSPGVTTTPLPNSAQAHQESPGKYDTPADKAKEEQERRYKTVQKLWRRP